MIKIIEFENRYLKDIKRISLSVHPGWFDANALKNIPKDIQFDKTYVALESNDVVGFISCSSKDGVIHVNWLAVDIKSQKKGIGRLLVEHIVQIAKKYDMHKICLETVVNQNPLDGTYDKTVAFYKHIGFKVTSRRKWQTWKNFRYRMGILTLQV